MALSPNVKTPCLAGEAKRLATCMRSGQLIRIIMARVEGSGDGDSDRGDQQFIAKPIIRLKLAAAQRSISIWTQKKWQVAGFLIGRKARMRFGNFVCLTFQARPSHCLAIVTAAENHFLAANDNHDIANRRIPIAPDLDFRRSVFAGHRNIFFRPERGSLFTTRKPTDSILSGPGGSGFIRPGHSAIKARSERAGNSSYSLDLKNRATAAESRAPNNCGCRTFARSPLRVGA